MDVVSSTYLRQNLAAVLDAVCRDREPVIVTWQNADPVVMLPLDEYRSLEATLHLLRSPRNADRLLQAIGEAEAGQLVERDVSA